MAKIESIAFTLYQGLRIYVPKTKVDEYDKIYTSRKVYNSKFVKEFFPKYINFNYWIKKPKNEEDVLLLNYFIIEVPALGVQMSQSLKLYNNGGFEKFRKKHMKKI